MISRRRFLTISASATVAAALPATASTTWQGHAFGAEVSITLSGERQKTDQALSAALDTIRRLEKLFSLYDPGSALSQLNRTGSLNMPPEFARLIGVCDEIHELTSGLFDPTVQPFFAAMLANGGVLSDVVRQELRPLIDWRNVSRDGHLLSLTHPGMALTLNGIAQGFATDRVTDVLGSYGFGNAVVNTGEYRVGDDPAALFVVNDDGKPLAKPMIANAAIATTSASGYTFADGTGHILSADLRARKPRWKTISVLGSNATVADGFSTALALAPDDRLARSLQQRGLVQAALLEDVSGGVTKIGAF